MRACARVLSCVFVFSWFRLPVSFVTVSCIVFCLVRVCEHVFGVWVCCVCLECVFGMCGLCVVCVCMCACVCACVCVRARKWGVRA